MEGLNRSTCSSLSEKELNQLCLIRGVTSIVYLLVCCFTLLLILYYQAFRTTLQRLLLCMSVALIAYAAALTLQISSSNEVYCMVVGFFNQYAFHVMLLFRLGTVFYLLNRVCQSTPSIRNRRAKPNHHKTCYEVTFVFFVIIFPLTYNWVPFITDSYGGRPWCWLKAPPVLNGCSSDSAVFLTSFIMGIVFPFPVVTLSTFVTVCLVLVYCRWTCRFRTSVRARSKLTQEGGASLLLMVVGLLYSLNDVVQLIGGIFGSSQDYSFKVLVVFAISPLIALIVPISLMIYLCSFKNETRQTRKPWLDYFKAYGAIKVDVNSAIDASDQKTFQLSQSVTVPSTTCYPYQPEFSDETTALCSHHENP